MKKYLALLCAAVLLPAAGAAVAFDGSVRQEEPGTEAGGIPDTRQTKRHVKPLHGFTPEREAAAIEFVRRHHAELIPLLGNLKKTDTKEYHRAITALFGASERLASVQQRSVELYDRELQAWKLGSRIQLLVAQIRMSPDDERLQRALRQALLEQLELRNARLIEDRNKLAERLEKLNQRIRELTNGRSMLVEKQMEVLLRDRKKHNGAEKAGRGKRPCGGRPPAAAGPS